MNMKYVRILNYKGKHVTSDDQTDGARYYNRQWKSINRKDPLVGKSTYIQRRDEQDEN